MAKAQKPTVARDADGGTETKPLAPRAAGLDLPDDS